MTVLELALQLPRFKIKNAVRFGFWAGEEFGLLGAKHYVAHLSEKERSKIALYLNFDMLASPNYGYFIYDGDGNAFGVPGPPGSDHIEKTFQELFSTSRFKSAATKFDGRSDYSPFFEAGIPVGGLLTGAEEVKSEEEVTWCVHMTCTTSFRMSDFVY
jgi:Zn-dependent M28 family amino/carboxypeptidase